MNKVITINLGGNAYQLEEGGYDALRTYLETASASLEKNPDKDEIISDIEQAIADKFRALLTSHKTVVVAKEVATVLEQMGPIKADIGEAAEPGASGTGASSGAGGPGPAEEKGAAGSSTKPKRLYRIQEGAMIAGVCNGIGAYFNIDPTFVRLGFVLLTLLWGSGLLVYIVLAIVVPEARSPEEKAAASGIPPTAQEFIRRAKEGYYKAVKGFPDRNARREWQHRFKREMRANAAQWRHNWHGHWAEHVPVGPGLGFTLPLLSLLHGMATLLLICALISLLDSGDLFGAVLPANVPVWVAALLVFIAYAALVWPLKVARHACYRSFGRPGWAWPFLFLVDAVVWLAVVATLLWLGFHYFPELRNAVQSIPSLAHQASNDVGTWWKGQ